MLYFLMGLALGGGLGWFIWWSSRREQIRLEEEKQLLAQEKTIVLDFMHHMVEAIGEGVDRAELFRRVVHAAVLSTGAMSACMFERDGQRLRGVSVEGLFPPQRPVPESARAGATRVKFLENILRSESFEIGEGLIGSIARNGQGILIENARTDPRVVKHDDPSLQTNSFIGVPVSFRDRLIGVLAIVNPADGGSFGEMDFSLARSLAEQAGLAIHNLDLMALQLEKGKLDMDLSLAREIQSMLLPKAFPEVRDLEFATVYRPAQKVGGDLYDVFPLGEDRYGVAIADVSGKGIPASLVMAITQSNLRHLARHHSSPAAVLRELNETLCQEMRTDMFVTLIYAIVDLRQHNITLCRAGHELPILMRVGVDGESEATSLRSEGMALGMVPNSVFSGSVKDVQVPFEPGNIFLLYTDGITEAMNAEGREFSSRRLAETMTSLVGRSAQDFNQGILDRVTHFVGPDAQLDDITLVTVKHR